MTNRARFIAILFMTANIISMTPAYSGPEISGIPRAPVDKAKMEQARLSAQLCGPGWTLSDDREHTPASFLCVPVKPRVQCPPNTQLYETDCSIGCTPKSD
ncbi:hypothetical protein [Nitrospira sp. BLG_1]|uniref:hypothetical protein n=1 Tax=Nitrospira sp. BLG_1 TaxID=3395883 RepID=UPI0039BD51ED